MKTYRARGVIDARPKDTGRINLAPSYAILIEILMGAFIYKLMEFITKPFSDETWNFIYNTFPHRRLYTIMLRIIL